jgi:von Willebrand factor type A domain-containing protein/FHA domain-containing protein
MLFLNYQRPKSGQGSALSLRGNRPEIKTDTILTIDNFVRQKDSGRDISRPYTRTEFVGIRCIVSRRETRPEIKMDTIYRVPTKSLASLLLCVFALSFLVSPAAAQDETPLPNPAAFVAYQCNFQAATNSTDIHAVLMGSDGRPLAPSNYTLTVTPAGSDTPVPPNQVTTAIVPQRPPLQMVIVLDITDTVPITQIVNAISGHLAPQLDPQDQAALITFSEEISPVTQFYTDKNRLINEHMTDLLTLEGDNRLYDAMIEAMSAFPFNSQARKIVLVLTDSGRGQIQQATDDAVIARAQRDNIEVYPIGFYSRDNPDDASLQTIANGTGGYAWLNRDKRNTRASIETAVSGFLDDFVRTLNSEITVSVGLQGLSPDANGRIAFDLTAQSPNEAPLTEQISCPYQVLTHSINFVDSFNEAAPVTGKVDIGVAVQSDLGADATRIIFRLNNDVIQNSASSIYTFDAANLFPGYYTIGAQLWDRDNNTLASTATAIRLYAQQTVQLSLSQDAAAPLSGAVDVQLLGNPNFILPDAQITLSPVGSPAQVLPLGTASFGADGRATLNIADIGTAAKALFPDLKPEDRYQFSAVVPGVSPADPPLATSNAIPVSIAAPVVQAATPEAARDDQRVPILIALALLALNILLFRWVGRKRVQRVINYPDDVELSPQLMTITVHRDGVKQPHTLTKKTVYVGRGSSNDINLGDDPNISRQHGVVMWRKGEWYYSNRKRPVMTRINGKRYRGLKLYKLKPVTELEIGGATLIFHSNAQQDISDFIKTNL